MLFQLEYAAVVKANALENSIPIQKAVIEHGNFRVCFRKEFTIDVNRERLRGPLRRARLVRRFYRSRLPLPRLVFYQCCASTAVCRFCKHKKISAVKQSIQAAFRPPLKTALVGRNRTRLSVSLQTDQLKRDCRRPVQRSVTAEGLISALAERRYRADSSCPSTMCNWRSP